MHSSSGVRVAVAVVSVMMCAWSASCAVGVYGDPIAVMLDRDTDFRFRRRAAQQAQAQLREDPRWPTALQSLLYKPAYPAWQRRYAIDQLIERDEDGFHQMLAKRITAITDAQTLDYVFQLARERGWPGYTAAAIRRYGRPLPGVPDADRPDRRFVELAHPDQRLEEVAFEVFASQHSGASIRDRAAAWEVLCRLVDRPRAESLLEQAADSGPLVVDLKAAVAQLHVLPTTREQLLWLGHLRDPIRRGWWERAAAMVARLGADQRSGLALRHLSILLNVDEAMFSLDRSALLRRLVGLIRGEHHHTPRREGAIEHVRQDLGYGSDQLSWADLATLCLLTQALRDTSLTQHLFSQAQADRLDTSSEHGGVLDQAGGTIVAKTYAPAIRRHDRVFYPPQEMIDHLYTALAHYHFHAQRYANHEYAGPGRGDRAFTKRMGFNCLVFTYVGPDHLNVDYYQPDGVVIDLGTINRPTRTDR